MGRSVCLFGLAIAIGALGCAPASAVECRLCEASERLGQPEPPKQPVVIEIETGLDFDRLVLLGSAGGTARLDPNGSRSASGGVTGLTGRAMVGSIVVRGEPNRVVRVDLPETIELWGASGARIRIEGIETDLSSSPRLDSTGRLSFRFGGELQVIGDAEGDFRGDIPITVEYL